MKFALCSVKCCNSRSDSRRPSTCRFDSGEAGDIMIEQRGLHRRRQLVYAGGESIHRRDSLQPLLNRQYLQRGFPSNIVLNIRAGRVSRIDTIVRRWGRRFDVPLSGTVYRSEHFVQTAIERPKRVRACWNVRRLILEIKRTSAGWGLRLSIEVSDRGKHLKVTHAYPVETSLVLSIG